MPSEVAGLQLRAPKGADKLMAPGIVSELPTSREGERSKLGRRWQQERRLASPAAWRQVRIRTMRLGGRVGIGAI